MRLHVLAIALLLPMQSWAADKLNVFACEPEWAALVAELAAPQTDIFTATTGLQDPHRIQARPSLIAKARRADLLICTGAELESGWLPVLINRANNRKILPSKPGHFMAAEQLQLMDIPKLLDRSNGDVHAAGNPHVQTDPRQLALVAAALSARLQQLDPARAALYQQQYQAFAERWQQAMQRWQQQAEPLKGLPVITQHRSWPYMNDWLGLVEVANLEQKPGIPPSTADLLELLKRQQQQPAKLIIHAAYQANRPAKWFAKRSGLPIVELAFTVGGNTQAKDLFSLFDDTIARLLAAAK